MIISFLTLLLSLMPQEPVVYKPDSEFVMTLDYNVRERTAQDAARKPAYDAYHQTDTRSGPLPYLILNFKITKLSEEEVRFKVVTNTGRNVMNKKIEAGVVIKLDLGYTDDIKDHVTPNAYDIVFQNAKRETIKIIRVEIIEDGTFFLNGEKRGKF
jgi:hypothetical protein